MKNNYNHFSKLKILNLWLTCQLTMCIMVNIDINYMYKNVTQMLFKCDKYF